MKRNMTRILALIGVIATLTIAFSSQAHAPPAIPAIGSALSTAGCLRSTGSPIGSLWISTGLGMSITPTTTGQLLLVASINYFVNGSAAHGAVGFTLFSSTTSSWPSCNSLPNKGDAQIGGGFIATGSTNDIGFSLGVVTTQFTVTGLTKGTAHQFYVGYANLEVPGPATGMSSGSISAVEN